MRIAFYAPLKPPGHPVPSGDRRVGRLLIAALENAGHKVTVASTLRAHDSRGDGARQNQFRNSGLLEAERLVAQWRGRQGNDVPQLWFTYHLYYKAPDWLGPAVSEALGIPYVVAEASYAPKRASGPWAIGHAAVAEAIRTASLVLCPTRDDVAGIAMTPGVKRAATWLPPFIDAEPYRSAAAQKAMLREGLALRLCLNPAVPWIAVVAMMRPGDKMESYRMLASSLARLGELPWHVLVAGDGEGRAEVAAALEASAPGRARILGELDGSQVADLYAACDLCAWPAVNEAYGMAMLEAQASGIPVVSRAVRGVPDVVVDGETGLLAPPDDENSFAECLRRLLLDPARCATMGAAAARFASFERDLPAAAAKLDKAIAEACANHCNAAAIRH